ncbi:hypothetical protein ACHAXR_009922 [Thalassiosira sp. AJA248-18]
MAPRIANDCFPDEFLTVDYDTMGPVGAPMPPGNMGGGGGDTNTMAGTHAATGDLNLDNDGGGAAAAAAMADVAELDAIPPHTAGGANNTTTGTGGGNNNNPTAIENDPLSMGQPAIAHSHSSASHGSNTAVGNNTTMEGITTSGTMGTTITVTMAAAAQQAWDQFVAGQEAENQQQMQQLQMQQMQPMQHHQPMAMEGITQHPQAMSVGVGGSGGGRHYSPSSIPQSVSHSAAASFGAHLQHLHGSPPVPASVLGGAGHHHYHQPNSNDTTPTTYQQLLLQQQHRQDIIANNASNNSNDPLSVHSAPAATAMNDSAAQVSALQHQHHQQHQQHLHSIAAQRRASSHPNGGAQAIPGRAVPRASSFGGFPTPVVASSSAAHNNRPSPLAPTLEELQGIHHQGMIVPGVNNNTTVVGTTPPHVATVSRSNSVTSSLTGNSAHSNSVHSSGASTTYHRFLSSLQYQTTSSSPLEAIPPSEAGTDDNTSSPQETYASIHSANEFSLSSPDDDDEEEEESKLSPTGAGSSPINHNSNGSSSSNSFTQSPKLPYSPSLLDQTSFPEEDNLSLALDDEDDQLGGAVGGDKYSPIRKLDWGDNHQDGAKMMDTTADTTMENSAVEGGLSSSHGIISQGLSSHVIHEDTALVADVPSPAHATMLRPRPSPFATSSSGASNSNSSNGAGVQAAQQEGDASAHGVTPPSQRRGLLVRNEAFEQSPTARPQYRHQISDVSIASNDGSVQLHVTPPPLSFGTETTISDLTYYAEKGCIVDVLAALTNPHLKTLGSRMLADYAKMPHRRVAVASNTRILEFVQCTALDIGAYSPPSHDHVSKYTSPTWLGREYAVETVRSLTAAEENDGYLMNAPGLLPMLALVARGGPFIQHAPTQGYSSEPMVVAVSPPAFQENGTPGSRLMLDNTMGVASDKARLHACIAIMNLSCGKSNKIEITGVSEVLEAMRDVMLGRHFSTPPRDSRSSTRSSSTVADEARLKATTCIKNLSNADANDAALLGTPGLVETLGYVAEATCHTKKGAATCTTHACLALMNLSISKANKNRVFRTPGVMDALMAVITRTAPKAAPASSSGEQANTKDPNFEARVKACSALSNLAIGYDNKIPMFNYPGFVESILTVIRTDVAEARTKACSILWSFAAEMKNQVPVVQRGDILPALVSVAKEDTKTEARFKCVAALTLLAESPENAVPLLRAGSLEPLMNVLQEAGPDPTQWRGQTASWCVGFLMNMAQCDDVVPALLQEGIVDLLAPLLSLDHYQSLKAAMAVTFVCQYDTGDKTYNLLRQTENVIPKIVGLLHNTLSGRGGSGYKYGVFTLRSSVGCIASLAAGPDFMKERIATNPVFESLLKVVEDFCVEGGTEGAIVGGGNNDTRSVTLAVRALSLLVGHLIPEPHCAAMPFGPAMDDQLITALRSFELDTHPEIDAATRKLAYSARIRIEGGKNLHGHQKDSVSSDSSPDDLSDDGGGIGLSLARRFFPFPCGMNLHVPSDPTPALPPPPAKGEDTMDISDDAASASSGASGAVRTFLLTDSKTGRRFAVPCDPTGGRQFNDNRVWCFRRGRYCNGGEEPDSNFQWSDELQAAYKAALKDNDVSDSSQC